jgi:hypothetical protein
MRRVELLIAALLMLALWTGDASALVGGSKLAGKPSGAGSLVEKVHGCHRLCRLGPAGWHYHAGLRCVRIPCGVFPGGPWIWRCGDGVCGWWHPSRRVWY